MSILYGVGAALTLDEFALWLNLKDVYFVREGRSSIDAVILFGSLLAVGGWGAPLFSALGKARRRQIISAFLMAPAEDRDLGHEFDPRFRVISVTARARPCVHSQA